MVYFLRQYRLRSLNYLAPPPKKSYYHCVFHSLISFVILSFLFLLAVIIFETIAEACLRKEIHILKELTVHCIVFIIRHFFGIFNTYGTGSFPPGFQGWHRQILFIPSQPPFKSPYLTIACLVYSEQVG